jgi:phenylacetic acid degradation operon negative regulatory protein
MARTVPKATPAEQPTGGSLESLKLSRRHTAGAGGTRGLLLTVLGELVLPTEQAVPTSAFIDVLGRLDVEEKASRQLLMRAAADGWLTSQRDGRYTRWRLKPAAAQFLTDGAERIYGFGAEQADWDGRWLLVLARVPETNRPARHLLRTRLRWAGFGSPAPGVWISTHPDRAKEAERVLDEAGVRDDAQIFLADYIAGGELSAMVHQAWDLDEIAETYRLFLSEFARQPSRDPLVSLVRLVHAWRRIPLTDPALPETLLPKPWIGVRAAALFHRQRSRWQVAANAEWHRITAGDRDGRVVTGRR